MTYIVLNSLILALAISLDTFVASFGYGLSKIKLPISSIIIMTLVNIGMLSVSIVIGYFLSSVISLDIAKWVSFSLLLLIGLIKFFSELIKICLSKLVKNDKPVRLKFFNFQLMLNVYADSNKADIDKNKILAPLEALSISVILSLDQIGVGLGHGINSPYPYILIIFNLFTCVVSILLGYFLGKKISKFVKINLSWLSGLILIILAVVKLFI